MKAVVESITKADIKFWIQVFTIIAGLAVGWGLLSAQVQSNKTSCYEIRQQITKQQESCQEKHAQLDVTLLEIRVQLAEMQRDILYIKDKVD